VPVLQRLGERHRGYGVAPQHYRIASGALIATLAEVLAEEFTGEVETAWRAAYQLIASIMGGGVVTLEAQRGARGSVTAPDPGASARGMPVDCPPAWQHARAYHRRGT
jgi:hypothetical protein